MSKIGIMGGTFNPIHTGHLILAEIARSQCELDKVIFIPSGCPAYKDSGVILPSDIRLAMVSQAIKDNEYFEISDIEIQRKGNTYTVDTLEYIKEKYPGDNIFFIMGADSINTIYEWYEYEKIFPLCTIIAALRGGNDNKLALDNVDKLKSHYGASIQVVNMPVMDISSTQIRWNFIHEKSIRYCVPDSVFRFLNENKDVISERWNKVE